MEAVLDANFILSCVRDKIDFISELESMGFKVVVPREVMQELKDIRERKGESREDRISIDIAFELIEKRKVKKMTMGAGQVDHKLIELGNRGAYIATLDRVIKRSVPNRLVIDSAKKAIMIERD